MLFVSVDEGLCVASGNCAMAVPEVFDQREDDGVSVVVRPNPPVEKEDDVREAVVACPGRAIRLSNGST